MPIRRLQHAVPALNYGAGIPFSVHLAYGGTIAAAPTVLLATYVVPSMLDTNGAGEVLRAYEFLVSLANTGTTSGTNTVKLVKNGDTTNGVIATVSIAYNASKPYASVSLRNASGYGMTFKAGDTLSVVVSAVAGGGTPGGLNAYVNGVSFGALA